MANRLARIRDWDKLIEEGHCEAGRMAEFCDLGLRQFERLVRELTGKSPTELIQEYRLRKAAEWLATGRFRTKTVMEKLHFSSSSHFCHWFKKFYGHPPQVPSPP
jgi:AraC-like DNA-binding protein